jgi:hypothetical protein
MARKPNPPILFSRETAEAVRNDFGIVSLGEHELKGIGIRTLFSVRSRKKRTGTDPSAGTV